MAIGYSHTASKTSGDEEVELRQMLRRRAFLSQACVAHGRGHEQEGQVQCDQDGDRQGDEAARGNDERRRHCRHRSTEPARRKPDSGAERDDEAEQVERQRDDPQERDRRDVGADVGGRAE
jgi:hypothetical protein